MAFDRNENDLQLNPKVFLSELLSNAIDNFNKYLGHQTDKNPNAHAFYQSQLTKLEKLDSAQSVSAFMNTFDTEWNKSEHVDNVVLGFNNLVLGFKRAGEKEKNLSQAFKSLLQVKLAIARYQDAIKVSDITKQKINDVRAKSSADRREFENLKSEVKTQLTQMVRSLALKRFDEDKSQFQEAVNNLNKLLDQMEKDKQTKQVNHSKSIESLNGEFASHTQFLSEKQSDIRKKSTNLNVKSLSQLNQLKSEYEAYIKQVNDAQKSIQSTIQSIKQKQEVFKESLEAQKNKFDEKRESLMAVRKVVRKDETEYLNLIKGLKEKLNQFKQKEASLMPSWNDVRNSIDAEAPIRDGYFDGAFTALQSSTEKLEAIQIQAEVHNKEDLAAINRSNILLLQHLADNSSEIKTAWNQEWTKKKQEIQSDLEKDDKVYEKEISHLETSLLKSNVQQAVQKQIEVLSQTQPKNQVEQTTIDARLEKYLQWDEVKFDTKSIEDMKDIAMTQHETVKAGLLGKTQVKSETRYLYQELSQAINAIKAKIALITRTDVELTNEISQMNEALSKSAEYGHTKLTAPGNASKEAARFQKLMREIAELSFAKQKLTSDLDKVTPDKFDARIKELEKLRSDSQTLAQAIEKFHKEVGDENRRLQEKIDAEQRKLDEAEKKERLKHQSKVAPVKPSKSESVADVANDNAFAWINLPEEELAKFSADEKVKMLQEVCNAYSKGVGRNETMLEAIQPLADVLIDMEDRYVSSEQKIKQLGEVFFSNEFQLEKMPTLITEPDMKIKTGFGQWLFQLFSRLLSARPKQEAKASTAQVLTAIQKVAAVPAIAVDAQQVSKEQTKGADYHPDVTEAVLLNLLENLKKYSSVKLPNGNALGKADAFVLETKLKELDKVKKGFIKFDNNDQQSQAFNDIAKFTIGKVGQDLFENTQQFFVVRMKEIIKFILNEFEKNPLYTRIEILGIPFNSTEDSKKRYQEALDKLNSSSSNHDKYLSVASINTMIGKAFLSEWKKYKHEQDAPVRNTNQMFTTPPKKMNDEKVINETIKKLETILDENKDVVSENQQMYIGWLNLLKQNISNSSKLVMVDKVNAAIDADAHLIKPLKSPTGK